MKNDILIAAYTKSGGSWLTWMVIDLITDEEFFADEQTSTFLDTNYVKKVEGMATPRKYNIVLLRHPLDVMCSAFNYALFTNRCEETDFDAFVDAFYRTKSLRSIKLNIVAWDEVVDYWQYKGYIVRYEDLILDPVNKLLKINNYLGLNTSNSKIENICEKYSFKNLKAREEQNRLLNPEKFKALRPIQTNDKYSFFNKGYSYYHKELLSEKQLSKGLEVFGKHIELYWPEA